MALGRAQWRWAGRSIGAAGRAYWCKVVWGEGTLQAKAEQGLTCLLSRTLRELTVRSSAAEMTCRPSLVQARLVTAWSCGWLALATPFVAKSQMMISPKAPPAAIAVFRLQLQLE